MHPQLSSIILLLVAFSSFLHPAPATHAPRKYTPHTGDGWRGELISCLNPALLADKLRQEVSVFVTLLGVPLPKSAHEVQPESPTPQNALDDQPRDNVTRNIVRSIESVVNSTVALGTAFNDALESASSNNLPSNSGPYALVLKTLAMSVTTMRDDFKTRFPLPFTAPGHADRSARVAERLRDLQRDLVRIATAKGVASDVVERRLTRVAPVLLNVAVLVGDVVELYPSAIEAFVLHTSAVLFPEATVLRSLVILGCLGPAVLGQEALGGWLLKFSSDALNVTPE